MWYVVPRKQFASGSGSGSDCGRGLVRIGVFGDRVLWVLGFGVWGLGFRVWGLAFGVWGSRTESGPARAIMSSWDWGIILWMSV